MINKWIQLKSCLKITSDNKVNWFGIIPSLGRIHKVIDENNEQIKILSVWIDKSEIKHIYGYNKPKAANVF